MVKFTPAKNLWKKLPSPGLRNFQIVAVQGQLLIVDDCVLHTVQINPNKILLWDESKESWVLRYPVLPYLQNDYSLVSYNQYLIVIAGATSLAPGRLGIDVLDTSEMVWYRYDGIPAKSLMIGSKAMVFGDSLLISQFCIIPQF